MSLSLGSSVCHHGVPCQDQASRPKTATATVELLRQNCFFLWETVLPISPFTRLDETTHIIKDNLFDLKSTSIEPCVMTPGWVIGLMTCGVSFREGGRKEGSWPLVKQGFSIFPAGEHHLKRLSGCRPLGLVAVAWSAGSELCSLKLCIFSKPPGDADAGGNFDLHQGLER